ncbi:MAG TPA: hypothetical protein GXX58_09635 [Gelria sp.]|jgi:hypothetical protein|nr:hypothetical protein [Gelria sp.]
MSYPYPVATEDCRYAHQKVGEPFEIEDKMVEFKEWFQREGRTTIRM